MFFKRAAKDANKEKADAAPPATQAAAASAETAIKPLTPAELRRIVDAKSLGFKSTADLEPAAGLIGQDRALRAIEFGANIKAQDFNVFVLGPPASGKSTAVKAFLAKKAAGSAVPRIGSTSTTSKMRTDRRRSHCQRGAQSVSPRPWSR